MAGEGGMCRSRMDHFIMSVKHREGCTELADIYREDGGGASQSWGHRVQSLIFRIACVVVCYGSFC